MYKLLSVFGFLLLTFFMVSCNSSDSKTATGQAAANIATDSANFTSVEWIDTAVNFGTVKHGEKVHIKFKCRNTGNKPLYIISARPSCGCTVADYTKNAIAPGEVGEVDAAFDSNHGSPGEIHKSIAVQTNTTEASPKLIFTGTVTPEDTTSTK